jgi:phospholipid/cholesterol/gamma-HCH transport system permease protein
LFKFVVDKCVAFLAQMGRASLLLAKAWAWVSRGRVRTGETLIQASQIGVESLPMVFILAAIGGGVLSLQLCNTLGNSGGDAYIGYLVSTAIIREIAPIFTALSLTARSGTAVASELAQMNVTSQVDAMKVLHINPTRFLAVPRLLACVSMMPFLCVFAALVGIISGMVVAKIQLGMMFSYYVNSIYTMLALNDIWQLLLKSLVFGTLLGSISITFGLNTVGGSREVGYSAMKTAVWVSIAVLMADLLFTWAFKALLG